MKYSELKQVVEYQQGQVEAHTGMRRDALSQMERPLEGFATIITGVRRCGKSTLMGQLMAQVEAPTLYINFDAPRFAGFEASDFVLVDQLAADMGAHDLFFDEIQLVPNWESYVRSLLDVGHRVTITGSNATMLSLELGTRLTGRHLDRELFPFSFAEYCRFASVGASATALSAYLAQGGFPQYLKYGHADILTSLLDDIIFRDIAVRYGVKEVQALRELAFYLITNVGNLVTANKLTQALRVKTAKTVLEYFSHFSQTYLFAFVPRYAYSYKSQMISPRKVYCIDNGLAQVLSMSASADDGRRIENAVYADLRQRGGQVFYYNSEGHECDFVVCRGNVPQEAIQVCHTLNHDNEAREVRGLLAAMQGLNIAEGVILTFDQEDTISASGTLIEVVPAWKWLSR